ncbi:MAG: HAMP domain-containing sensor histidine kinase, partial [Candidatus Limnocylindrales bacterium]
FAALESDGTPDGGGPGPGQGPGPRAGLHAQQIQQETALTLVVVALGAAAGASVLGVLIAIRLVQPLARLEGAAAAVARGELDARSGLGDRSDELGSLGRSFDRMAADLATADATRRRFFQDAAHELKTPLAVIDATTSAILDGVYSHEDRHLETIREQSRLLSRIVDDLRTISLAEAGALQLQVEPVDIEPLFASVARDMAARATAGGIRIDSRPQALVIPADADRLHGALAALVDNALRHVPQGGWVRLEAAPLPGGRILLAVEDSGPGIPEADLPHVFERFYRGDPARGRATGSSGLGLAIVRAVVEAHGGCVRAMNAPAAGARFELELPAGGGPSPTV